MSVYQQHQPEGSSDGLYLKLKDGDSPKLRILSDPIIKVYKEGDRPRYGWIVYNHDLKRAQIYEAGVSVYSQLAALIDDWGEPTSFDIRVKREGSTQLDTSYLVTPVKNSVEPPATALEEADKIDLIQATKGKLLSNYIKDGKLPDPVMANVKPDQAVTDDAVVEDMPQDMPPGFLTKDNDDETQ